MNPLPAVDLLRAHLGLLRLGAQVAELICSGETVARQRSFAFALPNSELSLQTQLLIPLELCNPRQLSFAMTTPCLPGVLTCFPATGLPPLEGPRGSDPANSLPGCSLRSSTSPCHRPGCAPRPGAGCSCSPPALGQFCLHYHTPSPPAPSFSRLLLNGNHFSPLRTPKVLYLPVFLHLWESQFHYL